MLKPRHTVAILQSNYLPWKGYFDIIHDVDTFIFYDDVQYTHSDWRNRNRVKTAQGPLWLTVPVGSRTDRRICDVRIEDAAWARRHWQTLRHQYGRAPHFAWVAPLLQEVYLERSWTHLSELNQFLVQRIARDFLGLTTRFRDSREWTLQGAKEARILELLRQAGATHYVSGPSARDYLRQESFDAAGIVLTYKDYAGYPEYPQAHPPFEHAVTVLDVLVHMGPDAPRAIWGWRGA
ncbi:WbqC family protein [Corallococcus exercitus]|uniref:WbqC family protein n=1 Tax=Corallococcus exercitus TaxID=2316736 RepID=UPI0035D529A1